MPAPYPLPYAYTTSQASAHWQKNNIIQEFWDKINQLEEDNKKLLEDNKKLKAEWFIGYKLFSRGFFG